MGSVVYVGRGAFRMEAVGPDGLISDLDGVVQPVTGAVTAPYHGHAPGENTGVDRLPVSATFRAPDVPSLFGSQVDVPLLAAPTGAVEPPRPTLALPRVALAALGAIVFACGVVIGAAAMRPEPVLATTTPAAAPAPEPVAIAAPVQVEAAPAPELAPLTTIALPEPVKIAVHRKAAARRVPVTAPAPAKPWVDPFAE